MLILIVIALAVNIAFIIIFVIALKNLFRHIKECHKEIDLLKLMCGIGKENHGTGKDSEN